MLFEGVLKPNKIGASSLADGLGDWASAVVKKANVRKAPMKMGRLCTDSIKLFT